MTKRLLRLLRHLWLDEGDALRLVDSAALDRIENAIRTSERSHSGEICLCIEASLPLPLLWRHLKGAPIEELVHERALELFGTMRVWDTELNNGVLVYVQLAEHRLEIVADRGLSAKVESQRWSEAIARSCADFREARHEAGLVHAIEDVGAALSQHFPADENPHPSAPRPPNQLPDRPVLR